MAGSREDRLSELLDRWEEAAERGERLDPKQLCVEWPELIEELTHRIEKLQSMDAHLKLDHTAPRKRPRGDAPRGSESTSSSFQLLERLAQGGLGVVYRARDGELHRDVVLKFIHAHIARSDEHRRMFRREAEVTSRLDHPGVVPVYGIGESGDGRIFYAMRYIQGETLDDAIARLHAGRPQASSVAALELRNLLSRFVTVCKTIAYAHNRGIIHRDIKPANVMLGRYGETLVVDWGLATPVGRAKRFKRSDEKTLMPASDGGSPSTDRGAGTPAYMSPEAARNQPLLTPATDIYSLGATLYKLLTGKTAFDAAGIQQLREQVIRGDFAAPRKVKRSVSKALEAICLKAMASDPAKRYATALELAADIENYLADEPVSAFHEPLPRRAARWARRHRGLAQAILVGVSILALVTVLSAVGLGYLARSEHEARMAAEAAKRQSLRMSSRFAARTIGSQIDVRWRILEAAGKDAAIRDALRDIHGAPQDPSRWEPAQAWLNEQFIECRETHAVDFSSLFVMDASGLQIARAPISDSIGQSFAFRDYFHGRGHDLEPAEAVDVPPISHANLSATYSSTTSGKLKVAFTVPLYSSDPIRPQVLGVLGMSVSLGDFGVLESDLQSGQIVVLVDARPDALNGPPRRGLILQHPNLTQEGAAPTTVRIDSESLEKIDTSHARFLRDGYQDPLAAGRWIAAFEPVLVEGRRPPARETGWVVLVQERLAAD